MTTNNKTALRVLLVISIFGTICSVLGFVGMTMAGQAGFALVNVVTFWINVNNLCGTIVMIQLSKDRR